MKKVEYITGLQDDKMGVVEKVRLIRERKKYKKTLREKMEADERKL